MSGNEMVLHQVCIDDQVVTFQPNPSYSTHQVLHTRTGAGFADAGGDWAKCKADDSVAYLVTEFSTASKTSELAEAAFK